MILHVGSPSAFLGPLKSLIESKFPHQDHRFWLSAAKDKYGIAEGQNVYFGNNNFFAAIKAYARLITEMHTAKIVMLHGLFNTRLLVLLALMPWLTSKCYWVVWGGDLYQYKTSKNSWRSRLKEPFRRLVIRRVGHLVTYIKGDVELARQWYGAKGIHHECIMYLSNVVDPKLMGESGATFRHEGLHILLGNSAASSNNHIEALERLLPFKDQNIRIFAPLSYGNQSYANEVIGLGKAWFGDKFVPMTDFMPFEQYLEFLKSLDIAIFNHQRQQAMGNTITLLGMGKTVFMRSDVSHWRFLKGLGIKLNDVEKLELCRIVPDEAKENAHVVRSYFSKATLIAQLTDIFEG